MYIRPFFSEGVDSLELYASQSIKMPPNKYYCLIPYHPPSIKDRSRCFLFFQIREKLLVFSKKKKIDVTCILEGNERAHLMERRRECLLVTKAEFTNTGQ